MCVTTKTKKEENSLVSVLIQVFVTSTRGCYRGYLSYYLRRRNSFRYLLSLY